MALRNKKAFLLIALLASTYVGHTAQVFAQDADQAEAEEEAREQAAKEEALREQKRKAPPTALPGAEGGEGRDMGHANFGVPPTVALFDAINRGSLLAAKEAISRGADIKGRNILGQTPLDMAIDLNRNDIMFLLLSLRAHDDQEEVMMEEVPLKEQKPLPKAKPVKVLPRKIERSRPNYGMGFLGF